MSMTYKLGPKKFVTVFYIESLNVYFSRPFHGENDNSRQNRPCLKHNLLNNNKIQTTTLSYRPLEAISKI